MNYTRRGVLFGAEIALFLLIGIALLDAKVGGSEKTPTYIGKVLSIPLLTGLLALLWGRFIHWWTRTVSPRLGELSRRLDAKIERAEAEERHRKEERAARRRR